MYKILYLVMLHTSALQLLHCLLNLFSKKIQYIQLLFLCLISIMSCKAAGATPKVISFEDFIKCDDSSSKVDNLVPKRKSKIKNLTSLSQPANNGIVDEIMCNQDAILTPEKSKKAKAVFIKKNVTECKHSSTNSVHLIKKHKLSMKSKKKRALLQESDTDEVVYVGISKSKTKTKSSQQISPPIKKQRSNDEDVTIVSVTPSLNNKEYLLAPSISGLFANDI